MDELMEGLYDLEKQLKNAVLPDDLRQQSEEMLSRLKRLQETQIFSQEYEKTRHYLDWAINLPWENRSPDILDLKHAQEILNKNHYGLDEVKNRILEYLAVLRLGQQKQKENISRAPILCLIGLVGTGKTTLAYSIAEAMGRKFERIPFGGLGDTLFLRGQSRLHPEAEPGQILKALRHANTKNPVILLDEIDRIDENSHAAIMGVLVELLDPEQNSRFIDHYLDYPFDLSEVLFIATGNNTTNISTAVLDRLEPLMMPSYDDEEKITIGRDYVLPHTLSDMNLPKDAVKIEPNLWPKIVRPLGYDAGIRTLERTLAAICRKTARLIVEGKNQQIIINENNFREFTNN